MTFEPDYSAPSSAKPAWWRRSWDRVRGWRPGLSTSVPSSGGRKVWRWTWRILVLLLILYYPLGALVTEDIDDDPQFAARQAIVSVPDAELGSVRMQGVVPRFSETPGAVRHAGPAMGQHNDEVYGGLGLSAAQIEALKARKVI